MSETKEDLSATQEDYLEAISHLQDKNRVARVKDVAEALGVSRGTVTAALKALAEKGLINYEPYAYITLQESGQEKAREIIRRHSVLKEFLGQVLGIDPEEAELNACRAEHALSPEVIDRLVCFLEFIRQCPRLGEDWAGNFERFRRSGPDPEACRACLEGVSPEADETGE